MQPSLLQLVLQGLAGAVPERPDALTLAEAQLSIASGRFCPELHAVLGSPEGAQAAAA
jgi:hypothetical protein